jgi:lipoate-protein ligase B
VRRPEVQALWLGRLPYFKALLLQRRLRDQVLADPSRGWLLLCEHPAVITLGRRSQPGDLRVSPDFLRRHGVGVFRVDRGGRATFHGPGQLVGYPIVSLPALGLGAAELVSRLALGLVALLRPLGVEAAWDLEHPGLWAAGGKLAALGLHTHRGVTTHGFALNLCPRLDILDWLDPCGLGVRGLTSVLRETGASPTPAAFAAVLVARGGLPALLAPAAGDRT